MKQAVKKKTSEHDYAMHTANLLEKKWEIAAHEAPDLIVTEDGQKFGLEVCRVFTGEQGRKGSPSKKKEGEHQRHLDDYRRKWEEKTGTFLWVSLVGNTRDEYMEELLRLLDEKRFSEKPYGDDEILEVFPVDPWNPMSPGLLTAHVMRVPASLARCAEWSSVNDKIGWVGDASGPIDRAIEIKSTALPRYRKNAGLDDVRLLIVADHMRASGMLDLEEHRLPDHDERMRDAQELPMFEARGFRMVYFLSYPASAHIVAPADCAASGYMVWNAYPAPSRSTR